MPTNHRSWYKPWSGLLNGGLGKSTGRQLGLTEEVVARSATASSTAGLGQSPNRRFGFWGGDGLLNGEVGPKSEPEVRVLGRRRPPQRRVWLKYRPPIGLDRGGRRAQRDGLLKGGVGPMLEPQVRALGRCPHLGCPFPAIERRSRRRCDETPLPSARRGGTILAYWLPRSLGGTSWTSNVRLERKRSGAAGY